ncbi:MAG: EamA family transporter [Halobacteria archaeon]
MAVMSAGALLAILAMVLWGFWAFLIKLALDDGASEPILLISYSIATVVTGIYALSGMDGGFSVLTGGTLSLTIAAGLAAGFGTVCYYVAIENGDVSSAATITGMYFVVATLLGIIILGESITLKEVTGIALAVLAVFLLSG